LFGRSKQRAKFHGDADIESALGEPLDVQVSQAGGRPRYSLGMRAISGLTIG
jgi:hypothetical protein